MIQLEYFYCSTLQALDMNERSVSIKSVFIYSVLISFNNNSKLLGLEKHNPFAPPLRATNAILFAFLASVASIF
jgi:hypothetical protein